MSKAKQRALEKYPLLANDDKEALEALKYIGMECDCASEYNEVQESKQAYFIEGYHQAEKDLELTCDDICEIMEIREDVLAMDSYENLYKEVLKRFKERKENKL